MKLHYLWTRTALVSVRVVQQYAAVPERKPGKTKTNGTRNGERKRGRQRTSREGVMHAKRTRLELPGGQGGFVGGGGGVHRFSIRSICRWEIGRKSGSDMWVLSMERMRLIVGAVLAWRLSSSQCSAGYRSPMVGSTISANASPRSANCWFDDSYQCLATGRGHWTSD